MMRAALSTQRRALAASGSFYSRNLREQDRQFLRSLHQGLARNSAETSVAEIAFRTLDQSCDARHVAKPFSYDDVLFVGPAVLAASFTAFSGGEVARIRAVPALDTSGPYRAEGALAVGNYLYILEEGDALPDGLRHGGFWAIPFRGLIPEIIRTALGVRAAGSGFFLSEGCILVSENPRVLFPEGLIVCEVARRPRQHLLASCWGSAGLRGARWQQDLSQAAFAAGLMRAASLTPGGVAVTACIPAAGRFAARTDDGRVLPVPQAISPGYVDPLGCVERLARVIFPAEGKWWRVTSWSEGIRPLSASEVVAPDSVVRFYGTANDASGNLLVRATLSGTDAALNKFWILADKLQASYGYWADALGIVGPGDEAFVNGVDFFMDALAFARDAVVVEQSSSLTEEQALAISDYTKLHAPLGRQILFSRPL